MKKYLRYGIYAVLFALLIGAFIYLGEKDFKEDKNMSDAQRFAIEYNIDNNNMFKYSYGSEIVDILNNKTGIIYLGFASNEWSKAYIKNVFDVFRLNNIKKVYYYDLQKDRAVASKYYRQLEKLLSDYLYKLDTSDVKVFTPALLFVKDGKIMHYDDETSIMRSKDTPSEYWTEERVNDFKGKIDSYLKEVNYNE